MQKSRKSPEWLRKGIIYQLFLRAFTPEGTIKAATKKLPKLKELGINIVYLSPVCLQDDDMHQGFWSERQVKSGENNPRNPYRVKDFYRVDPEYGTDADLKDFVEKCHSLEIRVFLDVVYFHCGPTAVFIEDHPDFVKHNPDGSVHIGQWNFPLLDFDNEKLREYLYDNMLYWVENLISTVTAATQQSTFPAISGRKLTDVLTHSEKILLCMPSRASLKIRYRPST